MKNNDNSLLLNDTLVNFNLSINVMMDLIMFTLKNLCDTIWHYLSEVSQDS